MASGVKVRDECKTVFQQDIKLGKKHRYVIYALSKDLKEIVVEDLGARDETWDTFCEKLHVVEDDGECRFAIFDLEYDSERGGRNNKLILVHWSPDTVPVKQKMVYASSKDAFKKALGDGIATDYQANDMSDLELKLVIEKAKKFEKK